MTFLIELDVHVDGDERFAQEWAALIQAAVEQRLGITVPEGDIRVRDFHPEGAP